MPRHNNPNCGFQRGHKQYLPSGAMHPRWKEDPAYITVHGWVYRWLGRRPKACIECGKLGFVSGGGRWSIQWANISGKYLRNKRDWKALCIPCHKRLDKPWLKRSRDSLGRFV